MKKIIWPGNISPSDRQFCIKLFNNISQFLVKIEQHCCIPIAICCSGGIDSTVMAHAFAKTADNFLGHKSFKKALIYVNHQLRTPDEINIDIIHIKNLAKELGFEAHILTVNVMDGNVQSNAREARYNALSDLIAVDYARVGILAHNANDNAETKLFQFIKGYGVKDLADLNWGGVVFHRPFVGISRKDIERYANIWKLTWSEDSSNSTNKYARNKIRHELIPWIEKEINPGIVEMLSKL